MLRRYKVVDVFANGPLLGNPVAVVLDTEGLSGEAMQAIARWTNLSETAFLLPPNTPAADYRLRIFTPRSEVPFAGHPTLGSAHAALEAGRIEAHNGRLVQECDVGFVDLWVQNDTAGRHVVVGIPTLSVTSLTPESIEELEAVLGQRILHAVPPASVNVGPVWVVAKLPSVAQLLALEPDFARGAAFERRLGVTGVSVFAAYGEGPVAIEVRSFAPSCGVNEDPVCGSGNGSIAVFQRERGLLPAKGIRYIASQGQRVGRDGRIAVTVDAEGKVTVGGACVTRVDGTLTF